MMDLDVASYIRTWEPRFERWTNWNLEVGAPN
jgi:hypothetical protein